MTTQVSTRYRNYVLGLLTVIYTFNFVDRQILGILAPYIQEDLGINDGQIGIIAGFYFAVFYTFVGLPIAWLADRYNRVTIVAVSLALWSAFTAASGLAQNFLQLSLARIGVGIGEAGGSPPSHSMLSDLFDKSERAKALGIYALGIPVGFMVAYLVTAYLINQPDLNWRTVFIAVGLPGIFCALLLKLTVKEPQRGATDEVSNQGKELKFGTAIRMLLKIPSYWGMALGISFASFGGYAIATFYVLFLTRNFPDVNMVWLLVMLGIINGVSHSLGALVGGFLADNWAKRNKGSYALIPAYAILIAAPCLLGALWSSNIYLTLVLLTVFLFFTGFYLGPSFSVAQTLAPVSVRAMSTAIFFFVLNMIALGGGPTAVGYLSEYFQNTHDKTEALRYAMASLTISYLLAMGIFFWTAKRLPKDLAEATHN